MRKKEIESKLNMAISNSVPDCLDTILAECEKKKGFEKNMKKEEIIQTKEKKSNLMPKLATALAIIVIAIITALGVNQYNTVYKTDSIIDLDINPSIEIQTNKKEEIIDVKPLNEDGKKILEDMDLERVDLDVAINAIIGSMLKNGYITVDQNSILVSVKNDDITKADRLKKEITKEIEEILNASSIKGSILSQTMEDTSNTNSKTAEDNNISEGKVVLINKILDANMTDSKGVAFTFETLSKLSINELNILLESKKTDVKNVSTNDNSASVSAYIGEDKAKDIAYKDAKVASKNVKYVNVEFDADDGKLIYEVEFHTSTTEYDYDIDAKTGDILEKDSERDNDYYDDNNDNHENKPATSTKKTTTKTTKKTSSSYIGKDKAKSIAYSNAGVKASNVYDVSIEFDEDDGTYIYEVEFKSGNTEYKYDINAKTGRIIEKDIDRDDD